MLKNSEDCGITSVCATALSLAGINSPADIAGADTPILKIAEEKYGGKPVERVILYNPDAVALWLYNRYPDLFAGAEQVSDQAVALKSVMPSVTPVCFASMYSGLMPEKHGIQSYTKPVLKVNTLFDYFSEQGKKCAIVSTAGDSISKIFLERPMDYYIYPTIGQVNRKAMKLIKEDTYDLIVIYNGNYDATMHAFGPEHKRSLKALKKNVAFYGDMVNQIRKYLGNRRVFYGFCPDHGCHLIDGKRGSHGLDMEEDMNVIHFYGML